MSLRPVHRYLRWLCWLTALGAGASSAHQGGTSFLTFDLKAHPASGHLELSLRDLEHAVSLDRDGDGAITRGELMDRRGDIAGYVGTRLKLTLDGASCPVGVGDEVAVVRRPDGAYAVLRLHVDCGGTEGILEVGYRLLFDVDPGHRGLLEVHGPERSYSMVLAPSSPQIRVHLGPGADAEAGRAGNGQDGTGPQRPRDPQPGPSTPVHSRPSPPPASGEVDGRL